ncbi:MAG: class I SAM-dependent methyltransferase [Promethearchaeota archaeon]
MKLKKNDKREYTKLKSNLDFKFMSFFFKIRDKFHDPMEKIEKTGIKVGDYVLDYGCGPGSFSIAAAEVVGTSGKVYAADIHPLAAEKINKKASKKGIKNIETITTDCNTRIKDNSIDTIICFDTLHDIADQNSVSKEFYRVLKTECLLSIDDHHLEEKEIISLITAQGFFKLAEKKDKLYNFIKIVN